MGQFTSVCSLLRYSLVDVQIVRNLAVTNKCSWTITAVANNKKSFVVLRNGLSTWTGCALVSGWFHPHFSPFKWDTLMKIATLHDSLKNHPKAIFHVPPEFLPNWFWNSLRALGRPVVVALVHDVHSPKIIQWISSTHDVVLEAFSSVVAFRTSFFGFNIWMWVDFRWLQRKYVTGRASNQRVAPSSAWPCSRALWAGSFELFACRPFNF